MKTKYFQYYAWIARRKDFFLSAAFMPQKMPEAGEFLAGIRGQSHSDSPKRLKTFSKIDGKLGSFINFPMWKQSFGLFCSDKKRYLE